MKEGAEIAEPKAKQRMRVKMIHHISVQANPLGKHNLYQDFVRFLYVKLVKRFKAGQGYA